VQARAERKQRAEKLLEDAHLKLSSVLTDIHGASGRDMLDAIIVGERDPAALAQLARGMARRKLRQLEEALDCTFLTDGHVFVLKRMLRHIGQLNAEIAEVAARIVELCRPWEGKIARLPAIPGFSAATAQDLIAEIGVDMSVFPTPGHLASWARQARGDSESARRPPQEQGSGARQPLHRRHPRRGRRQRRPHPDVPRRQVPSRRPLGGARSA
jgi:transposase